MSRWLPVLLLWPSLALGGALERGAQAFESGDLDGAIEAWGEIAREGDASGVLHYDLGVAYYRRGDLPRAVAHWRDAKRIRPRDGDVTHNLALARSRLQDVPPPVPPQAGWLAFFTVGEVGLLAALLLAGASALGWWRRRAGREAAIALVPAVLGLAVGLTSLSVARKVVTEPIAVVVDAPAVVRDTASPEGKVRFELPPGSEVQVERALGDFLLVHTARGERGWMPASGALLVRPGPAS